MRLFSLLIFLCSLSFSPLQADYWVLPAQEISVPITGEYDTYPQVSVNADGKAVAVWQHRQNASHRFAEVKAAMYDPTTKAWTPLANISGNAGSFRQPNPQVGIDSAGNAIVIWVATNSVFTFYGLVASIYNASTSQWSSPIILSSNTTGFTTDTGEPNYSLAVEESTGNGVVVWISLVSGSPTIQAKDYYNGIWSASPSSPIGVASGLPRTPDVGVDSLGNAIAIWQVYDSTSPSLISIQTAAYTSSNHTWSSPSTRSSFTVASPEPYSSPKIDVNSAGNAVAVWQINTNIATASYTNGGSWSPTPFNLSISTSTSPMYPQVSIDSAGNAVAAWQFYTSSSAKPYIQANTYTNNEWLLTTTDLTPAGSSTVSDKFVQTAIRSEGKAIVSWTHIDGSSVASTQATTFDGSNWSGITTNLGPGFITPATGFLPGPGFNTNLAYNSDTGMDAFGNGIVVWPNTQISTPTSSLINAATYLVPPTVTAVFPTSGVKTGGTSIAITGTNFTGATDVKFGSTSAASFVVNSATSITAVAPAQLVGVINITVITPGGTSAVTSADQYTYFPDAPSAPSNFSGQERKNVFFIQTDVVDVLTWTPSSDTTVIGYKIFCEGVLVATTSATGPFTASIHNRIATRSYTYTLAAYNAAGNLSNALTTTVQ